MELTTEPQPATPDPSTTEVQLPEETPTLVDSALPVVDRLTLLETALTELPSQLQDTILSKVAQMLTDNIYDIIPGYAQLTEQVYQNISPKLET